MKRNHTFALDIGWQPLLRDMGISAHHVLRRAGLPEDRFSHQDRGLTSDEYFRFWRAMAAEAGDELFPLRIVAAVFQPAAVCGPV